MHTQQLPSVPTHPSTSASPRAEILAGSYRLRLAVGQSDLEAAQRLRFEVFNLELNEGLDSAYLSGLDQDRFDEICDHLIVEERETGEVVGTYRLQTGVFAAANHGYYSEQEFDFTPFESIRCELVELGRACVHRDHRKLSVLNLLWRGIAQYALGRGARYLIGCSSLTSQDAAHGQAMYELMRAGSLVEERFRTRPVPAYMLPVSVPAPGCPPPPKLLRAYLSLGAKICGPPALDREFKTIDFLTFLDLAALPEAVRNHFLD
jgi:putative hemolysin